MLRLGKFRLGKRPCVVVPFGGPVTRSRVLAARRLGMDAAEFRADLFGTADTSRLLRALLPFKTISIILTVRSKKEGGGGRLSDAERLRVFQTLLPHVDAVDIELSSKAILKPVVREARRRRKTVIISFHDFKGTPPLSRLKTIGRHARAAGADVFKAAAQARSDKDLRTLAAYVSSERHPHITIAMGRKGALSRVLFPSLGSLVTFASLGKPTAPGQMDLRTTVALLRRLR